MPDASAIEKPEGTVYNTTDQMMVEVLLMAGHSAVSVRQGEDGHLVYNFKVEEIWTTLEGILTGKAGDMKFTYADWWKAKVTWQMNLRHLGQTRRNKKNRNNDS